MGHNQPRKIIAELATEFCHKSSICFKCSGNHQRNDVSYEHNFNSKWNQYPNYDWNEIEVRQPSQGENNRLKELMFKFIKGVEERFIQNDAVIESLTMQVGKLVSMMSENLLHSDGEYMKEKSCENEPTRDDEHLEREVATLQEDRDSVEIVEDKVLIDCESVKEEFIPISSIPQLNYEDAWIDPVKECKNKLRIILRE
ncbi:hypothetical protein RND71_003202 [Anisodus tanguticus]|uniref:Uncharacterized protein n=1 Tax=Anisodus tanguticus TaxID=243964 RepID=A0AAE1SW83_9SOLA|nr:hypothetical protein RND71_003202 [Anisodus tanguticus]